MANSVNNDSRLSRPLFFDRQNLDQGDLNSLVEYIREKERRHNRHVVGWGVTCGLSVSRVGSAPWSVQIGSGYAVMPSGEEVFVPDNAEPYDVCVEARACLGIPGPCPDPENLDAHDSAGSDETEPRGEVFLALCPDEEPACFKPGIPDYCQPPDSNLHASRMCEGWSFKVLCQPPAGAETPGCEDVRQLVCEDVHLPCPADPDQDCVVIATLTISEGGVIAVDEFSQRRKLLPQWLVGANSTCACDEPDEPPPTIFDPTIFDPTIFDPTIFDPTIFDPTIFDPTIFDPTIFDPTIFDPTIFDPTIFDPTIFDPTIFDPTIFDPTIFDPTIFDPTIFDPGLGGGVVDPGLGGGVIDPGLGGGVIDPGLGGGVIDPGLGGGVVDPGLGGGVIDPGLGGGVVDPGLGGGVVDPGLGGGVVDPGLGGGVIDPGLGGGLVGPGISGAEVDPDLVGDDENSGGRGVHHPGAGTLVAGGALEFNPDRGRDLPVSEINGVGSVRTGQLNAIGIRNLTQFIETSSEILAQATGLSEVRIARFQEEARQLTKETD